MSINSEGFISNVFEPSISSHSMEDVRQSMVYNHVKSYPSANSSNSGQIHSEENVRWLSKQFSKKPFIIQYDNNDMEEFKYEGTVLNSGSTTGGMANIDGYIISTSADMSCISFDNQKDTMLGTHSINGDTNGYIDHQALQVAVQQFMNGLQSSNLIDYIIDPSGQNFSEYTKITELIMSTFNIPVSDNVVANDYLELYFSNTYKKEHGEIIQNEVYKGSYNDIDYEIPVNFLDGQLQSGTQIQFGWAVITYTGDVKTYIENNFDLNEFTPGTTESGEPCLRKTYIINYGIIGNKLKPKQGELLTLTEPDDTYKSSLYIVDVFGFYYIFEAGTTLATNTFPYTGINDINFYEDTNEIVPRTTSTDTKVIEKNEYIYDVSKVYTQIISSDIGYQDLENAIITADESYNIQDFYKRDTDGYLNNLSVLNCLSEHFETIESSTIITEYINYNGINDTIDSSIIESGDLKTLNDYYYCLNFSDNSLSNIRSIFKLESYEGNLVPIGFITSSGSLMAKNFEKTFVITHTTPTTSYQDTYKDENGNIIAQQIYVESYMSFFKRVCTKLYNINKNDTTGSYGNISNLNDINNEGWKTIFKQIQYGELTPHLSSDVQGYADDIKNFFDVLEISDITFAIIYNKLIAPYMNFFIQLSWSQLYDNTATEDNKNKFKAIKAGSVIPEIINNPNIIVKESNPNYIILERPHTYGNITVNRDIRFNVNTYTDYNRLNNFLCKPKPYYIIGFPTYDKENNFNLNTCQDYISYIKGCTRYSWIDYSEHNNAFIQIPYKITTLDKDNANIYDGFAQFDKIVDRFANYTDNTSIPCKIVPGYIQNVVISTQTLLPMFYELNNDYNWYKQDVPATDNVLNIKTYSLELLPKFVLGYDNTGAEGVGGYCFNGITQGWVIGVPALFRLYKDSQNYLEGKQRASIEHAGVYIDYKLPYDITNTDFWFTTLWISTTKTVMEYDIESSGTSAPTYTDGMDDYLNKRNHTIFSKDTIYDVDKDGNYLNFTDIINKNNFETIKYITNILATEPKLEFVDVVDDEADVKKCAVVEHEGVQENLSRLKSYVDDSMYKVSNVTPTYNTIHIANNTFYELDYVETSTILNIKTTKDIEQLNNSVINKYILNTTDVDNTNTIFRSTIKVPFKAGRNNIYKVTLDTIFNDFGTTNKITTVWNSNYPIKTIYNSITNKSTYEISIYDHTRPDGDRGCALLELTIHLNEDKTFAIGHCEVSMVASEKTMTPMDMNFLWKELYKLDVVSWEQVSNVTKTGLASKLWNVGDTKTFNVTFEGVDYPIQAMIIGFDQETHYYHKDDSGHSITWMTNIYNNNDLDVSNVALFNHKFNTNLKLSDPTTGGTNGYNGSGIQSVKNAGYDTEVCYWMNYTGTDNMQPGDTGTHNYGIARYITDENEKFLSYVAKSIKTTGMVFTAQGDPILPNGEYKVVFESSTTNYDSNDVKDMRIPSTITTAKHEALTFWLPSLSELNLSFISDDIIEETLNARGYVTRTQPYEISETYKEDAFNYVLSSSVPEDWGTMPNNKYYYYNDVNNSYMLIEFSGSGTTQDPYLPEFVSGKYYTKSAQPHNTNINFYINEAASNTLPENIAYEYFSQSHDVQNVKSVTMLTSSYYTINVNKSTGDPEHPYNVQNYEFDSQDYSTVDRYMYVVGASYDSNETTGRWFTILNREDVQNVIQGKVNTDFCFITI